MLRNRVLLVTNYFPPEKGAASNRMHSMAMSLAEKKISIEIIAPFPNYPIGKIFEPYRNKFYAKSVEAELTIYRLWVWPSNSKNIFLRLLAMTSFALSLSIFFVIKRVPRIIIIQYSPIFIGATAVFWSWVFRKKIILNVSDLWPLAGLEMGLLKKGVYYSILKKIEIFCYKKSSLILGQSREILSHVESLGIRKKLYLYQNIPEFDVPLIVENNSKIQISIVYAGLLGIAQGIYNICTQIKFPENVTFHVYGTGPEAKSIQNLNNNRIIYHGEIERLKLHQELLHHDIAFIPLIKRIYGSVPSKIFEYTRLGLPVLYFAGGEGAEIVTENNFGWTIPPDDLIGLQQFIGTLNRTKLNEFPRETVQQNHLMSFNFEKQLEGLLEIVYKL